MEDLKVLELFSGVGGMHLALRRSGIPGEIKAAIDINTLANRVYQRNFPGTYVTSRNILSLSEEYIEKLDLNAILMSPPCQPFTRLGNQNDVSDARNSALQRITDILPRLSKVKYILLENVFGFESSQARDNLMAAIDRLFNWREFDLTPRDFKLLNSRRRYYLIAVRKPLQLPGPGALQAITSNDADRKFSSISELLEFNDDDNSYERFLLTDKDLRRVLSMDIVTKHSSSTCCFTKSYGRYAEGTGSVYSSSTDAKIADTLVQINSFEDVAFLNYVKPLRLRYFTPKEIQRLMCFPEDFTFPDDLTNRQIYSLLGNSINVKVVSYLIEMFRYCK